MTYPRRHTLLKIVMSLCVLGAIVSEAAAQQPTKGQANALRSACRKDFMSHCSNINPNGPAALTCLQRNSASLSSACRTAVSAVGAGSAPARPALPLASVPAPAVPTKAAVRQSKGQENALSSACRNDFMAHCSNINPNGPAALTCLQRNSASLSSACRTAVSAMGGSSTTAPAQPTAIPAPALTQDTNVAFVEAVSGSVVVFAQGKPDLLAKSDIITDRAQLDLKANSELRICHYKANRLLTLRGPSRAFVSADSVTDESGRAVNGAVGTCAPPGVSR
jgi:hypothetical protein